jgi:hypothetical protein
LKAIVEIRIPSPVPATVATLAAAQSPDALGCVAEGCPTKEAEVPYAGDLPMFRSISMSALNVGFAFALISHLITPALARADHTGSVCLTRAKNALIVHPGKWTEFAGLMDNHMTDEAIRCCLACTVKPGTKVLITDWGFTLHTIRVLNGPETGCVGDLAVEDLTECDKPAEPTAAGDR